MENKYGFENLQNVLSLMHKAGNKKVLNLKNGRDMGVPDHHLMVYVNLMKKLYEASDAFGKAYFAVPRIEADVKATLGPIREAWHEMLACSSDSIVVVEPIEEDLVVLGTYASKFVSSEVNFELKEKWSCAKAPAPTTPVEFQKSVETLVGVRVDGTARLTPEERDYTNDANGIVNNIRSASRKLKDLNSEISGLKAEREAVEELPVKAYIAKVIAKKEAELKELQESIDKMNGRLAEVRAMTPEQYVAKRDEEKKAEVERRRTERRNARKEKKSQAPEGTEGTKEPETK